MMVTVVQNLTCLLSQVLRIKHIILSKSGWTDNLEIISYQNFKLFNRRRKNILIFYTFDFKTEVQTYVPSRTYKCLNFQGFYQMNLFDFYFTCIYIQNHIWWGWQGRTTGNYQSKDPGLMRIQKHKILSIVVLTWPNIPYFHSY